MKYTSIQKYYLNFNVISLFLFNICAYSILLLNIFLIIFLFDTRFFKTLNELRGLGINSLFLISVALVFLSMAGMPPLLGFFSKFFLVIFFLNKNQFFIFFFFLFLNFFVIYFYILNIRFVLTKSTKSFFFLKNYNVYINFNLISLICFINFFNICNIFFLNDFIFFFNFLCSFNF